MHFGNNPSDLPFHGSNVIEFFGGKFSSQICFWFNSSFVILIISEMGYKVRVSIDI